MSKIIQLKAENFKRLSAVEITPAGNVVIIGGNNAQGKTSVLDSIEAALGGEPDIKTPVKRGATKSRIVVDLGNIVVERRFTDQGGTSLVVRNKDGIKQMSPQAILDKLVGTLTFDPLAFSREKPVRQAEILRGIVGIDFTDEDKRREAHFDKRTDVKRDAKALESRMAAMPHHDDAPDAEVTAGEIVEKQQTAISKNAENEAFRVEMRAMKTDLENVKESKKQADAAMRDLEEKLRFARTKLEEYDALEVSRAEAHQKLVEKCEQLKDEDLSPYREQLSGIESANRKFRDNAARAEVVKQFKAKTQEAETHTAVIEEIDANKRKLTMEAKFPIDGLSLDASGNVIFDSFPLDQASESEKLKVSVAIGLVLNPSLKVILIRDGSLLDESSMKVIAEMAKAKDAQIWLERVGAGDPTAVIIEDGHIAGVEPPKAEPEPETAPERADEAKPEPPPEEQPAKKPVKKQPKNPGELFE